MADKQQEEDKRPLKNLLEKVYEVHRNDIKDYASGHLNLSKLMKSQSERHSPWESSKEPPIRLKAAHRVVDYPVRVGQLSEAETVQQKMEDTLIEFSLGPIGSMTGESVLKLAAEPEVSSATKRVPVNVEELHLPEIMIPVAHKDRKGEEYYENAFLQSYLNQPTKRDQFASFKDFEDKVIHLKDANDRGVLTGEKTVRMLHKKLLKKLNALDSTSQRGPNFHRLQIYTDIWQEIIDHSDTFGGILKSIKDEYDNYMSYLLDTQRPSQHKLLYHHLDSLAQDQSVSGELKKEQERVAMFEKEARSLLEENERLKIELKEEEDKAAEELANVAKETQAPKAQVHVEDVPKDLEEQVNDLHTQIFEKLEAIEALKRHQRQECVPVSVCHHLEQCVKETEVDIQKLLKQNEFLEQSIVELEKELEELMEKSHTDENEARKMWKGINTLDVIKLSQSKKKKKKSKKR
ncbi:uncharacterized protein LOC116296678 [Actinia tenebrosa]|uniref:Uncharacterized protein LOC116296678 n=1 Tax=Actinia tenebrosa TaxID=6105 RepID=A0A6P8HW01_ACTTE|nr:uncharacterized protein LOC116296678 [Actinia tenebrosa]